MRRGREGAGDVVLLAASAAAVVVAGWLFVRHGSFVLERIVSPELIIHTDFDTFYASIVALRDGADIYRTGASLPNLNPPLFTVVLAPLGLLGVFEAYRLFVLVTVVLVIGAMVAVAAELRLPAGPAALATAAVLISSPLLATLGLGQIYALLAVALTVAWIAGRRARPVLEGVALGLLVALKPSLAPVLLLSLARRRWTTLGTAIATGLVSTAVGVLIAGDRSWPGWLALVLGRPIQTYFDNASLVATVVRLTTPTDWGRPLVQLPDAAALVIGFAAAAAVVGLTGWRFRREHDPAVGDTALWAMAAASLLASPISWHNYLVLLFPGVLVLLAAGRWPPAVLLLTLPLIGMEWPPIWYVDGVAPALPLSLYCGILICYWMAFTLHVPAHPPGADRTGVDPTRDGPGRAGTTARPPPWPPASGPQ